MPKVLSLKKNAPAKNQKAITQFFKTANPSTSEKTNTTPAKCPVTQDKCVYKRSLKRKLSFITQVETIDITDDSSSNGHIIQSNCSQNGYQTPKKFKSEVNGKNRTPFKQPIRKSPQKENGLEFNESITGNKNAVQNNESKNKTPDKTERISRSPLTPVEDNNINRGNKTDNLSEVEELEKNHENQMGEKKISPRKVLKFETQIEHTNSSPKKVLHKCDSEENIANKIRTPIKKALIDQDSVIHVSPKKFKLLSEDVCGEDASPSKSGSTVKALDFNDDMFQDEFGVLDFDEECAEDLDLSRMQRCEVISVKRHATRIELRLKNASNNQATCFLEGIWLDTPLSPGEVISVTASRDASGHFCVGNTAGLLVLRPDHLISSTSVVAGVFCKRKAVLQERYRGIDSANTAMTIGILIHELVQKALTERIMDASRLRSETDKIIKESIQMLYDAGLSEEEARSNMEQYIAPLASFMQTYVGGVQSNAKQQKDQWTGQIDKVLDIEENLCCPQLGLKGKIDATLQVTIHERKARRRAIVPLELKSGKASVSAEHRGQLVLYGMMLSLLRNEDPTRSEQRGLLLYLKERVDVREVSCGYPERRDLIMLRNQLVQYLATSPQDVDPEQLADIEDASCLLQQRLPDPVNHQNACQKCPYLTVCSLHLWHTDGPSVSESHPLSKLQGQALGHLSPDHVKYFLHWAALLKMEERGQMSASPLHALWTDSAETRLECQEVSQTANTLKVKLNYIHGDEKLRKTRLCPAFICGALITEFKFESNKMPVYDDDYANYFCLNVSLRFKKLLDDDDFVYTCKLTNSKDNLLVQQMRICDDHWIQISQSEWISGDINDNWMFDVTLSCETSDSQCIFASLYDDSQSADFKLCCGEDGSVQIHKYILATYSPVLNRMLEGDWKESKEGRVALQGVSLETLQHLKDYMYLNKLPETGLQELCALASCYMIPRLVTRCCAELLNKLTTDNAIEVAEFATRNSLRSLLIAVLKTMGGDKAKIDKMALGCKSVGKPN